jgi:Arc/MetJ-type ribon-helix-helix transcriptional regulator
MVVVTVNLPDCYIKTIEGIMGRGFYYSRSEFIRYAIMDFLTSEIIMKQRAIEEKPEVEIISGEKLSEKAVRIGEKLFKVIQTNDYLKQKICNQTL